MALFMLHLWNFGVILGRSKASQSPMSDTVLNWSQMCVISSQKWLKRAKIGVLHGTPKKFMRPNKGVSDTIVQDQMNNKIYLIRFGHTKALLFEKI